MADILIGVQLAQVMPLTTAAVTAFSATIKTEITRIVASNVLGAGGAEATMRIFHDDDGSDYSASNALYYDQTVSASNSVLIDAGVQGGGLGVSRGGTIGVRSNTTAGITFTIYGVPQQAR